MIKDLQERINSELQRGNLGDPISVSRVFDPPTREAIKRIQTARGEPATGEIRPKLDAEIRIQNQ